MSKTFTLTEQHLTLLRAMYVGWQDCETGAPEIDPKRPYGNSSVECDVHELLTGESNYELTDAQREHYMELHRQTQTAMQIILQLGSIPVGVYDDSGTKPYHRTVWRLSQPPSTNAT